MKLIADNLWITKKIFQMHSIYLIRKRFQCFRLNLRQWGAFVIDANTPALGKIAGRGHAVFNCGSGERDRSAKTASILSKETLFSWDMVPG